MAEISISTALFYDALVAIRRENTTLARRAWAEVDGQYLTQSWARIRPHLLQALAAAQIEAAAAGTTYGAFALAEEGTWQAPEVFVDPRAFAGWSSSGAELAGTLDTTLTTTKEAIGAGLAVPQALERGWSTLSGIVALQISDAGRVAAGADLASRRGVGYVRMLNPPSCARCVVLAGKWFRWNEGFRRHPRCDCVHRPSTAGSLDGARSEGLVDDPYAYFHGLDRHEQDRIFGQAQAEAIRDGGDIYQVINSARGRVGAFTTEGTSRNGYASTVLRARQRRMTPETIYRLNPRREDALQALRDQGYILPAGQVPGGSLRGARYEGFGQLGRGGTRRAASHAIEEARRTGVRDPNNRYTMTAAERRLYDAEQRYRSVLEGRSPYVSPAFGNTPDPTGTLTGFGRSSASGRTRPPTPLEAAIAEADYRRWLASGGQIYL